MEELETKRPEEEVPVPSETAYTVVDVRFRSGGKTYFFDPGDLTLAEAQKVLDAALVKAKAQGVPMNIAIVDAGGNLKAFVRQDGAFIGSIDVSTKKAVTARYFNMPTSTLGAASQPGQELFGIEATNGGLVIFGGGELLIRDNVIVGAIGVSGGSVAEDTNVAKAGAAALK